MATQYHNTGGINWSLAASWHDGVHGAGAVPIAGDTIYFTEGSDVISAGLSPGLAIAVLSETEGSSVRLGGSSASLVTGTITLLDKGGKGAWYIAATAGTATITSARIRDGYTYISGGTVSALDVLGGEVVINSAALLTSAAVTLRGGVLTIEYGLGSTASYTVYEDTVLTLYRPCTALTVNGGRVVIQIVDSVTVIGAVTINGGSVDWRAGNATDLFPNAGKLTFENQMKPLAITNAVVFKGTKVRAIDGANGLTVAYTVGRTATDNPDLGG